MYAFRVLLSTQMRTLAQTVLARAQMRIQSAIHGADSSASDGTHTHTHKHTRYSVYKVHGHPFRMGVRVYMFWCIQCKARCAKRLMLLAHAERIGSEFYVD